MSGPTSTSEPLAPQFRDFVPRLRKLREEFLSSQLLEKKNVPAWALMLSLVCFRYRNCVYTYRILPNEDDKFTVQVSPLHT